VCARARQRHSPLATHPFDLLLRSRVCSDPISDRAAIPYDECSINPFVTLVTTPTGGHSMDWSDWGGAERDGIRVDAKRAVRVAPLSHTLPRRRCF
jgi:hypothetical protein